jgi:peptide/nickel transport system substrate-binding protein
MNARGRRLGSTGLSLLTVGVIASALAGAGTASTRNEAGGALQAARAASQITVALPSEVPPFDPQKYDRIYLRAVTDSIYEPLLGRSSSGRLIPLLARALPKQLNSTTWQFKIRKGIKFTNGEPLDARAAGYSIGRIADPRFNSELLSLVDTIASVRAVDRYTLNVTTTKPDVLLPARMPVIKILPPKYSQTAAFLKRPMGTGPYLYVSGAGTGPIVLKRNPKYWGGKGATIQTIRIRAIPDVSTRISALRAGEVNLVTVLPPDAAKNVPKVATAVGFENPTVILNSQFGLTKDVRIRKALNLAVDKNAIAKALFAGYAAVAKCQPLSPSSFGYNAALKPYAYNPTQARALLRAAGADGKTVTLVGSDVFTNGTQLAQVIASYWTAIGLKVNMQIPPFQDYLKALFAKGESHPDAVYVSTSSDLLDASSAARQLASDGVQSAYSNASVDKGFQTAASTGNPAKREAIYHTLLKTACDDAALVNLITPKDLYGTSKNLRWTPRFDGSLLYATMKLG